MRCVGGCHTCGDRVREVLYVLLADDAVKTVVGHRALTVALTTHGAVALRTLLAGWNDQFRTSPGGR